VVEPTGIIFVSSPGNVPAAQITQITNPSTSAVTFTTSVQSSGSVATWFQYQADNQSVSPGPPQPVSIQPSAGLPAGVYTGSITFHFSDGSERVVSLLWVVAEGAPSSTASFAGAFRISGAAMDNNSACSPTKLLAVFTLLGANFTARTAFPTSVQSLVVDDCGLPLVKGSVELTFSNGDPQLEMKSVDPAGAWTATWVPGNPRPSNLVVTLSADSGVLQGTTAITGSAPANPGVPIIAVGGVATAANYSPILAPGTIISIFGDQLTDATANAGSLPLPTELSNSVVIFHGQALPLFYVSKTQINAMVPYGLEKGTYYVIVTRGPAYSTSVPVALLDTQPGVFTRDSTGKGEGVIFGTEANYKFEVTSSQPAKAGDTLTVYCAGLGEVQPLVEAGSAGPSNPPAETSNRVTATIGGIAADVSFAGLAPGFAGLYQVNLKVPAGAPAGNNVPLVLTVAGQSSSPVAVALR
jgi:uncharacterized protein (TIGR03437 family)